MKETTVKGLLQDRSLGVLEKRGRAVLLDGRPTTNDSFVATFGRRRSGGPFGADPVGREPSDAATVWKHTAADRCAALADRIARGGGEVNRSQEGGGRRDV